MSSQVRAKSVRVSAIVHATEDPAKVAEAMTSFSPQEMHRSKGRKFVGHYGNEIRILESVSRGSALSEKFLWQFWGKLSALDRREILSNMDLYVDDSGRLFLRVNKQLAFEGELRLEQTEAIKIEISFDMRSVAKTQAIESVRGRLEALAG